MNDAKSGIPQEVLDLLCRINLTITGDDGKPKSIAYSDFMSELEIDYNLLEQSLEQTPATYSLWCFLLAEAECEMSLIERKVKRLRGMFAEAVIKDYNEKSRDISERTGSSVDKLAQWQIKELMESDDDINKEELRAIIAKRNFIKIKGIVEGLRMKSEHLRSLAGFKRQERRDTQ